jgi:hypothetical protein
MHVQSSRKSYSWPVSTARARCVTPRGNYSATSLQRIHYSQKYDMLQCPIRSFSAGLRNPRLLRNWIVRPPGLTWVYSGNPSGRKTNLSLARRRKLFRRFGNSEIRIGDRRPEPPPHGPAFGGLESPRQEPAECGPFGRFRESLGNWRLPGWGGRIRTSAWRNQNPLPYHLATPQSARSP